MLVRMADFCRLARRVCQERVAWRGRRALGPVRHRSKREEFSARQGTLSAWAGGRAGGCRWTGAACSCRVGFEGKHKAQETVPYPSRRCCLGVGPIHSRWWEVSQQTAARVLCCPPGRGAVGTDRSGGPTAAWARSSGKGSGSVGGSGLSLPGSA